VTTSKREPIQQISAEPALIHQPGQMLIGGRYDAHIDTHWAIGSDPRHFAIFHRAQQPFLRSGRQRRKFIKEQRAAIRFLKAPGARLGRAGKGPRFMAEQFGLDQCFGERRAVHGDERAIPARGEAVEAFGDKFLARPAFADHQNGPVERRGAAGPLHAVEKGRGLADEIRNSIHTTI
jgi:hypothetical protein